MPTRQSAADPLNGRITLFPPTLLQADENNCLTAILRLSVYKALYEKSYQGSKTTMTKGEWSCLISYLLAPPSCSERAGNENSKWKCLKRDSNPHPALRDRKISALLNNYSRSMALTSIVKAGKRQVLLNVSNAPFFLKQSIWLVGHVADCRPFSNISVISWLGSRFPIPENVAQTGNRTPDLLPRVLLLHHRCSYSNLYSPFTHSDSISHITIATLQPSD